MLKKKRKLSIKQKLAGFGGKRAQSAERAARRHHTGKKRSTTTHKVASKRRKTGKSTTRTGGGVSTAIKIAIGAVVLLGGAALETWVAAHGGWTAVIAAYKAGGPMGLLSWAQNALRNNQPDLSVNQGNSSTGIGKIALPITGSVATGGPTPAYSPFGYKPDSALPGPIYQGQAGQAGILPFDINNPNDWDSTVFKDHEDTTIEDLVASGAQVVRNEFTDTGGTIFSIGIGNDQHFFDENGNIIM
jgi:hypothetical protein